MKNGGYTKKRPCSICRAWFQANSRVGERQKTCGKKACQNEWVAKKNKETYQKNKDYHRDHSLRGKLEAGKDPSQRATKTTRKAFELPREEMEEVLGQDITIVLEYLLLSVLRKLWFSQRSNKSKILKKSNSRTGQPTNRKTRLRGDTDASTAYK